MEYVTCPNCQAQVEVPETAGASSPSDFRFATWCDQCGINFDYDESDVQVTPLPPQLGRS